MELINAVAKARFNATKPQRIHLHRSPKTRICMLCFEPGQKLQAKPGDIAYYVISGKLTISADGSDRSVPAGQLVSFMQETTHQLLNDPDRRAICLEIAPS
ncbi:MAG: cupin domain-containing protein [Phycisphaerae bacterium]